MEMGIESAFFDRTNLGLYLIIDKYNSGYFDTFIQDYHKLFGFHNGTRGNMKDNVFGYNIYDFKDKKGLLQKSQELHLRDLVIYGQYYFPNFNSANISLSADFFGKIPTGDSLNMRSNGKFDFASGLCGGWAISSLKIVLGGRYLYLAKPEWGDFLGFREHNFNLYTSIDYLIKNNLWVFLNLETQSLPYTREHPWLVDLSGMTVTGIKTWITDSLSFQFYMVQEFLAFAAMDVVFSGVFTLHL